MEHPFLPEGRRIHTVENRHICASLASLRIAMLEGTVVEGYALRCTPNRDLIVQVGSFMGTIPHVETAIGIETGATKDIAILSCVGKVVSFTVTGINEIDSTLILSRRQAQEQALRHLLTCGCPGTILPATVTHMEPFGAFVDIGCGLISMIGVEHISVSRIPHPDCRFTVGQEIYAVILHLDASRGRIYLTHRELLGTWSENVADLTVGTTLTGIVRSVKDYGIFVELSPNLSGLAECRLNPQEGESVSVYVKAILPHRMKLKLLLIDRLDHCPPPPPLRYYITQGRLTHWQYGAPDSEKTGPETSFL